MLMISVSTTKSSRYGPRKATVAMTLELTIGFIGYAFVTSITPGPNNTMLLASGVNFGLHRSWPHIAGINQGFGAMMFAVGLGADTLFAAVPYLHETLKVVGTLYLLYLAWRIASDRPMTEEDVGTGRPMTFLGAAAFQWVNPKAWMMVIGAISTYVPDNGGWRAVAVVTLLYVVVNLPCIITWTALGIGLRRILTRPRYVRWFNYLMAMVLCLSVYPSVAELLQAVAPRP